MKTLTKRFSEKVLDSSIKILDCDGCELNEAGRKHILDKGMEACFEKCYELVDGKKIVFVAVRLAYEAQDVELI